MRENEDVQYQWETWTRRCCVSPCDTSVCTFAEEFVSWETWQSLAERFLSAHLGNTELRPPPSYYLQYR